jgi:hypothetical protein
VEPRASSGSSTVRGRRANERVSHVAPRICLRYSTNMDILTVVLDNSVAVGEITRGP